MTPGIEEGEGRPPRCLKRATADSAAAAAAAAVGKWGCMQGAAGGDERLMRRFQGVPTLAFTTSTPTPCCQPFFHCLGHAVSEEIVLHVSNTKFSETCITNLDLGSLKSHKWSICSKHI